MTSKEIQNYARLSIAQPAPYRIRIQGQLEEHWTDRMGGMQISQQAQKEGSIVTTLEGQLIDQAALFGVLVALYNLRLPLISVECLETNQVDESPLMKVRVEQRADYLEFIVTGLQNELQAPKPLESVLHSCELAGLSRALVDYRGLTGLILDDPETRYAQGVGQLYREYLGAGGSPLRVAVVGNEEVIEAWKLNEEIVRGYGLEALVTDDYEEAVAWLNSDTKGP